MNIKKIDKDLQYLRQISKEVEFNQDLTKEIVDLEKYVMDSCGFAIAAIQLGYNNRIVYVRCTDLLKYYDKEYNEKEILINPVIIKKEGLTTYWEACLSCMDNTAIVPRPYRIEISYYDINGNKKSKTIEGFPSTVISHEYDHLDGILHMDKGLEILQMNAEERIAFREKYGYIIYEKNGNFEDLVKKYDYDINTKNLTKKQKYYRK